MTDLFGTKVGTPDVCARLLGEVLGTKFRRHVGDGGEQPWYVADDDERGETIIVMANRSAEGVLLESYAPSYQILFYVERSPRQGEISRKLATETSFRFLECGDKLRTTVQRVLAETAVVDENSG